MFWPIGNELLLTFLAPDIITTFHGAMQVPRLVEPLSVEITRSAALAALQEDEKLCHLHLCPYFVLFLRDTNFECQILRNLYNKTHKHTQIESACLPKIMDE